MWSAIGTGAAVLGGAALSSGSAKKAAKEQAAATRDAIAAEERQFNLNRSDTAPYRQAGQGAVNKISDLLGIGSGVESDPRYQAVYDQLYNQRNAEHVAQYGKPLESSQDPSLPTYMRGIQREAEAIFRQQNPETPTGGEFNKKFTEQDFQDDPVNKLGFQFGLDQGTKGLNNMAAARGMRNSGATLKALTQFGQDYAGTKAGESRERFYGDQDRTLNRLAGVAGTGQTATMNNAALGSQSTGRVADLMSAEGNSRGAASIARGNTFNQALGTIGNWWNQQNTLNKYFPQQNAAMTPTSNFAYTGSGVGGYQYG